MSKQKKILGYMAAVVANELKDMLEDRTGIKCRVLMSEYKAAIHFSRYLKGVINTKHYSERRDEFDIVFDIKGTVYKLDDMSLEDMYETFLVGIRNNTTFDVDARIASRQKAKEEKEAKKAKEEKERVRHTEATQELPNRLVDFLAQAAPLAGRDMLVKIYMECQKGTETTYSAVNNVLGDAGYNYYRNSEHKLLRDRLVGMANKCCLLG